MKALTLSLSYPDVSISMINHRIAVIHYLGKTIYVLKSSVMLARSRVVKYLRSLGLPDDVIDYVVSMLSDGYLFGGNYGC